MSSFLRGKLLSLDTLAFTFTQKCFRATATVCFTSFAMELQGIWCVLIFLLVGLIFSLSMSLSTSIFQRMQRHIYIVSDVPAVASAIWVSLSISSHLMTASTCIELNKNLGLRSNLFPRLSTAIFIVCSSIDWKLASIIKPRPDVSPAKTVAGHYLSTDGPLRL